MYFIECPYCNNVDGHNTGFCTGCGAQYTADAQKLCINCRNRIPVNNKFCGVCGTSIVPQQAPQPQPQPIVAQQPVDQPQNVTPQPTITNNYYTTPNTETNVVIGRKRRSCLFDCFMILITGGIWIIWMLVRR